MSIASPIVRRVYVGGGNLRRAVGERELSDFAVREINDSNLMPPAADLNAHGLLLSASHGNERPYVRLDELFAGGIDSALLTSVGITAEGWESDGHRYLCIRAADQTIRTYKRRRTGACRHDTVVLRKCRKSNCWRNELDPQLDS